MGKLLYLDNAATTKTAPEVVDAMLPYFTEHYGNPSSVYSFSSGNKEMISEAERSNCRYTWSTAQMKFILPQVVQSPTTGR